MDLKKTPLAVALFLDVVYLLCGLLVWIWPQFSKSVFQLWFHGVDLNFIWNPTTPTVTGILLGLISTFVFSYIATLIFVKIYKSVVK